MLVRPLGRGGSGDVWEARAGDETVAIKFLARMGAPAYERFCNEVDALGSCRDVCGVLPLVDRSPVMANEDAWYAMPIAQPASSALRGAQADAIIEAVAAWARTLETLHERGISHRDIKPGNLYRFGEVWSIGDFGLARLPRPSTTTRTREIVGAKWTIAPEMRRGASKADGRPADVYSLAKTLWILLSGEPLGFDGQYASKSAVALRRRDIQGALLQVLEDLLVRATDHEPTRRPTAQMFAAALEDWRATARDFERRSRADWAHMIRNLSGGGSPSRVIWTNLGSIIEVLNACARMPDANHMFYPTRGGNDLEGAELASEEGCIALIAGGGPEIVRPRRLLLELIPAQVEWSYFRLEVDELEPALDRDDDDHDDVDGDVVEEDQRDHRVATRDSLGFGEVEEAVEIAPGEYIERMYWDEGWYGYDEGGEPLPLPASARLVSRCLRGDFVIFAKLSPYNLDSSTYDARHAKLSTDQFREYIEKQSVRLSRGARGPLERRGERLAADDDRFAVQDVDF
jgi:serine/threonine-protein kinase